MRFARVSLLVAIVGFCGSTAAQTIFNIQPPPQPQGAQQEEQQPRATQAARPASIPQIASPSVSVDPKVMAQYDQRPNESIEDYQIRMNALSQRAIADMERVSREQNEKMKALVSK